MGKSGFADLTEGYEERIKALWAGCEFAREGEEEESATHHTRRGASERERERGPTHRTPSDPGDCWQPKTRSSRTAAGSALRRADIEVIAVRERGVPKRDGSRVLVSVFGTATRL